MTTLDLAAVEPGTWLELRTENSEYLLVVERHVEGDAPGSVSLEGLASGGRFAAPQTVRLCGLRGDEGIRLGLIRVGARALLTVDGHLVTTSPLCSIARTSRRAGAA